MMSFPNRCRSDLGISLKMMVFFTASLPLNVIRSVLPGSLNLCRHHQICQMAKTLQAIRDPLTELEQLGGRGWTSRGGKWQQNMGP